MEKVTETSALKLLILVLLMPYVTGFHVAIGGPWMIVATLVNIVCVGLFMYSIRDRPTETISASEIPAPEQTETPSQPPSPV